MRLLSKWQQWRERSYQQHCCRVVFPTCAVKKLSVYWGEPIGTLQAINSARQVAWSHVTYAAMLKIISATCLTTPLRDKLHEKWHRVTGPLGETVHLFVLSEWDGGRGKRRTDRVHSKTNCIWCWWKSEAYQRNKECYRRNESCSGIQKKKLFLEKTEAIHVLI